jgi:anti-anti-sigma regulatory factor
VAVVGPIRRADIDALCARVRRVAEASEVTLVICDVRDLGSPDGEALDALARLQLIARRMGREMRLRNASPELRDLLALAGLADVLR